MTHLWSPASAHLLLLDSLVSSELSVPSHKLPLPSPNSRLYEKVTSVVRKVFLSP